MQPRSFPLSTTWRRALAVLCAIALGAGSTVARAAPLMTASPQAAPAQDATRIPADQLDSLVAPIALYPDPMLAQTLAASTYPLELMQLQQWLARNAGLKGKALADAVAKQPWDPSVQAMAALPEVVNKLADNIQWTTDLGNAFLAQQSDVMHAVQRMRAKAQNNGNLQTTPQQVVETRVVENQPVIVIEQASPDVVYVPNYQQAVVYGPPVYPYPDVTDDDYPWGYAAGAAISFGAGVAMGAFWGSGGWGGWGWRPGWGGDWDVNINRNANFIRNSNFSGYRGGTVSNYRGGTFNNRWQHNPAHRGGAPYRDRATANRYGGAARGDSLAARQSSARQQISQNRGNLSSVRSGTGTRGAASSLGTRAGSGNLGTRGTSGSFDRTGQLGSQRNLPRSGTGASQLGQRQRSASQAGTRDFSRAGSGTGQFSSRNFSADRVGQRDLSRSGSSSSAFGSSSRYNGSHTRASSSRGSQSFQSRSGGSRSFSGGSRSFGGGSRSFGGGGRSFGGGGRSRGGGGRR